MKSSAAKALAGRVILVTRPRGQAAALARLIGEAGGGARLFPAIEIEDLPPPAALGRLQAFDLAIFVSPTAAAKVMPQIRAWPQRLRAAAVGAGTRRELERHGVTNVISPAAGADSEALLQEPELARVSGKHVVIFRGEGGRALLGDTLRSRGAQVEYAECYRRSRPKVAGAVGRIDAVTVSSVEGLANLFEMLDPALLRSTPHFVAHERIAEAARQRAVREVVVAGPSDDEMVAGLMAYFQTHD